MTLMKYEITKQSTRLAATKIVASKRGSIAELVIVVVVVVVEK